MNRVFLVSYYFAPLGRADGVNRTYLVKELSDVGWDIEVITGERYRSLVLNFQKDESLLRLLPSSVRCHRFKSDSGWLAYDFKKLLGIENNIRDYWIEEALSGFHPCEKGIFMAIVPPIDNAILAYELAKKHDCPLALYYPDKVLDVSANIVKCAKVIFCVTEEIRNSLRLIYKHPNIIVVEHGLTELKEIPSKGSITYPVRMAYAGSFNFRIRPELVGKAYRHFARIDPDQARNLVIDFYGPKGYYFWLFLKPYLNDNVRFRGYLPFERLMNILTKYDIALTVNFADVAFPSKVFHYLNAGLPLFAVTRHNGLISFINEHNIGLVCDDSVDQITEHLSRLIRESEHILDWRKNVLSVRERFCLSQRIEPLLKGLEEAITA